MPATTITTPRLIVRPFAESDLGGLSLLIRDKMAAASAPYDTQWPTDDGSMRGILKYYIDSAPWSWCAVELKATGHIIGFVCAGRAEDDGDAARGLGYTIRSDYQNNGYAYEACLALMGHCETALGTRRFTAGTADCNTPSVRLLAKLGFVKIKSFEASFAKDAGGNPITFAAGEYERGL